jgi:tRNA threonylcarbamoyladenosine biosynthesis protein TsaE
MSQAKDKEIGGWNEGVPPRVTRTVSTAAGMRELGTRLAAVLRAGDLVILTGDLGAGKTTLTQGIGAGLGVRGPVTSPTFVIARVHPPAVTAGRGLAGAGPSLLHADAYRLGSRLELDDLDLDTDTADSVTVVEWGGGLAEGLAADRMEITISREQDTVTAPGDLAAAEAAAVAAADAADAPRIVRIWCIGERWEGIKLPLMDLADRL